MLRTHTCGQLRAAHAGQAVTLAGWVHRRRDHGGLIFVDLRDRDGLTQVVFDPDEAPDTLAAARELGNEWVVAVDGRVRARPEGLANPDLPTGEVEVVVDELRVLNGAKTPPFPVAAEQTGEVSDTLRLTHRYLDLRRRRMRDNLVLRHEVTQFVRQFLNGRGFLEIETPILIKATPEGARDFIVPSRVHPGQFYALPQSPQQLKQLLMVAGLDRYYQLARCFRDEDPRADRELEFTQLDIEMAFVDEADVMALTEELLLELVAAATPERAIREVPFPHLTYAESMARYGNDKPDLRFGLPLVDLSAIVADSEFRVFSGTVADGGQVKAVAAPHVFSRREIDELEALARELGAKGLAWLALEADGVRGSVARFLSDDELAGIRDATGAEDGSTVLIVAGPPALVARVLGRVRVEVARRLELIDESELAFCWIVDPPLVEWDDEAERWDAVHHPFTSPKPEDINRMADAPGQVRARAYDIVCNGYELGGGSIRIHDPAVQARVFDLLGIASDEAEAQFGHLLEAFRYGAPPHGGIAWGFDRTVAVLAGEPNIRDVIAFPKTLSGTDPMTGAPSPADPEVLDELGLRLEDVSPDD